ncbi:ABC transporter substrate-binding protein [Arhodomonas sp. AD133]|uniref:ABC transporter substrate-binding protein n=1 Tax=Arhodomonas sp. AD133 TaxID=3415009 RepID=UPI003EB8E9B8
MQTRHLLRGIVSATALSLTLGATSALAATVKVTSIVEHPALDAVRQGTLDELEERGYTQGDNLDWEFQTAQGDVGIAGQIARKYVGDAPDVIVAIATPSAQAAVSAARGRIPVVFSAVTDPVDAKLVDSLEKPGGNVTGVSDMTPLDKHLAFIKELLPELETLGVPYNPGEANAAVLVDRLKELAPEQGVKIETASAPSTADVLAAARSLVGKVDAMYVTTDNTLMSAFESVAKVGMEADIPVFSGDTSIVDRGAAAGLGFDYYDIGRQTGALVARVLDGESAGEIPVQFIDKTLVHVNPEAASEMGLELPQQVIDNADEVVE